MNYLRHLTFATLALATGIGGTLVVQQVRAAGVPTTGALTYTGVLALPDGTAVTGSKPIGVAVYDAVINGNRVCDVPSALVPVTAGHFQIALPEACTTEVKAGSDLWVEIQLEGVPISRTKLGAVPYAIEAGHALVADRAAGELKTTLDNLAAHGPRVVKVQDSRTGCPPAAATNTDLISISFTLIRKATVNITGRDIRLAAGRADLALIVDGRAVSRALTYTPDSQWATANVEWFEELAAGDHSASLRGTGAANIWGCSDDAASWGHLTALIFD